MNRFLRSHHATGEFDSAIRDHFVDVHVGLRAGAGLPDPKRKLLSEETVNHFARRLFDQRRTFRVQLAQVVVHLRRSELQYPECANEGRGHRFVPYRKVMQAPLGLRTPVVIRRYLDHAHRVGLHSHLAHRHLFTFSWQASWPSSRVTSSPVTSSPVTSSPVTSSRPPS